MTNTHLRILVLVALSSQASAQDSLNMSKTCDFSIEPIRRAYLEGRDKEAVVLADEALLDADGAVSSLRAEIHFWRGAALRRLKRYNESIVALDAAHDLGFPGAELPLERALALRALGRQEEAEHAFQDAERQTQEDPQKLEELRKRWKESADLDKKFQLRLDPRMGYDSNILAIDANTALAQDIDRQSFYYGALLSARFAPFQEKEMSLLLDYQNNLRGYASEPGLSYSDNLLSVIWQSPVGKLDWLSYEVRSSYGETWLQGEGHFRTQRILAPALIFRPDERWQIRLGGDYTNADYYEATPEVQDRDGSIYRIALGGSVDFAGGWNLAPSLTYWTYQADGDDYDHHAWDLGVVVTTPEFSGFQLRLGLGVVLADYDHPHSLSTFTQERSDRRYSARVTLVFHQIEKILGFAPSVSLGYEKWTSNLDAFDFDRVDLGGSADILAWSF